jgi:hypothetical protein
MPLMKLVQNPLVCLGDAYGEAVLFEKVGQARDKKAGLIVELVITEREVEHLINNLVVFLIVHQVPLLGFRSASAKKRLLLAMNLTAGVKPALTAS